MWLLKAGRGSGKTRAASEFILDQLEELYRAGEEPRLALVGRSAPDVRDVMIEGESGLAAVSARRGVEMIYIPSKRRVVWPELRAQATAFTAEEPRQLRGPQHHLAWAEEVAAWRDAKLGDLDDTTWSNLMMGLRLGNHPRVVATTTPKPLKLIVQLVEQSRNPDPHVVMTEGSTFTNRRHLPDAFLNATLKRYRGTRLERQEIYGELIEDIEGALWSRAWIEEQRVQREAWWDAYWEYAAQPSSLQLIDHRWQRVRAVGGAWVEDIPGPLPLMQQIVVGVDPSASTAGDEAGIIVAGKGTDGRGYVFDDASLQGSPLEWAQASIGLAQYYMANRIVAEKNNGGEMVMVTLRQVPESRAFSVKLVHASRGKQTRAEPVAALYEQGLVTHVGAERLAKLEDELCSWTPLNSTTSPNRLDALVWAMTELFDLTPSGSKTSKLYAF